MAWSSRGEGRQTITVTVIIGVFVAVLGIAFSLNLPDWVKGLLVVIMAAIGLLDFWALTEGLENFKRNISTREYERGIQRHPELVDDLLRLNKRIHEVLYERRGDHPSLALQGAEINAVLYPKEGIDDFSDRLTILMTSYQPLHQRIAKFGTLKPKYRTTTAIWQLANEVSTHLGLISLAFTPLYRGAARTDTAEHIRGMWQDFVSEYNVVLTQWKEFTERMEQAIHSGAPAGAAMAKPLPSSVK